MVVRGDYVYRNSGQPTPVLINPIIFTYPRRYIVGTDENSLKLFLQLCSMRVYVDGFIDDVLKGKTIYHKRIYSMEDISKSGSILLVEDSNINDISGVAICDCTIGINSDIDWSNAYIYGAGYMGKKLLQHLLDNNIKVNGFIDCDETKVDTVVSGARVYHTSILPSLRPDIAVIETGKHYQEMDAVVCKLNKNVSRFFYMDMSGLRNDAIWVEHDISFDRGVFLDLGFDNRKIYLCGKDKIMVERYFDIFKLLDFEDLCIAKWADSTTENEETAYIEDALLEENSLVIFCSEVIDDEDLERLHNLGMERGRDFCDIRCDIWERQQYMHSAHCKGLQVLDVNLAYTRNMGSSFPGIAILGENLENDYKIAVLGASTSTSGYFWFKSWPEFLYEKYTNEHITILNGAVEGYTSAQELIKLMRDIVCLKPDLVIVYDGYNDMANQSAFPDMPNIYAISYMKTIMEYANGRMGNAKNRDIFCGIPSSGNAIEDWLKNIEYMNAICKINHIKFVSFIQPLFYSKPKMTLKEDIILQKKWDFHFGISEAVKDSVKELRRCAAEISRTYEYIFDLSSIFDASDEQIYFDICHVLDKGNAIIADEIYEIIQKRM